jgi:hypothetical protein
MGAAGTGSNQQQWHWQEGNKYAVECMKALLLLNGGAPVDALSIGQDFPKLDRVNHLLNYITLAITRNEVKTSEYTPKKSAE